MARQILIIIGAIIILILLGLWVFLLFFSNGTSDQGDNSGIFANLDFGDTTETVVPSENINQEQGIGQQSGEVDSFVDVASQNPLRQLTTRTVAGYSEVQLESPSSSPMVYFIESGVGHVFSINLETGEETRVSGTSIPGARLGDVSRDGQYFAVANQNTLTVGSVKGASTTVVSIPESVTSLKITAAGDLVYSVLTNNSTIGKKYDFNLESTQTLFTVPFRESRIIWGEKSNGPHYVYPKASGELSGTAYRIDGSRINRLPIEGAGLTLIGSEEEVFYTTFDNRSHQSYVYNQTTDTLFDAFFAFLPEKCTFGATSTLPLVCGFENTQPQRGLPDVWYKGIVSYADSLWVIDPTNPQPFSQVVNILEESGREVDVINVETGRDTNIYFQNRHNGTLWLYEYTPLQNDSEVSTTNQPTL